MKTRLLPLLAATLLGMSNVSAQPSGPQGASEGRRSGQRVYKLIVSEGDSSKVQEFNRGIASSRGTMSRGLFGDIVGLYRQTFTGQAVSASSSLIDLGITALKNAAADKRPQWESAVRNESRFVRQLPMQHEILDFYSAPSTQGPLDPTNMLFNGFGCRQVIETVNPVTNKKEEQEVFYLSCKVRLDDLGIARMLKHSKFEVYVDSLRFNPSLCDLPNDSLGEDIDTRIGLSFEKRKDLKFAVKATITSSWVNQAMQVFNDQYLGEFSIEANIDPKQMDGNVFTYSSRLAADSSKVVRVFGDCFLVPRSYVGATEISDNSEMPLQESWGTGQYKVEMQISETCSINQEYYQTANHKWDKSKWKPEWQAIKKRSHGQSGWSKVMDVISTGYANNQWVVTLLEPMKTTVIQVENQLVNGASSGMPTSASASAAAAAAQATQTTQAPNQPKP